MCLLTLFVCPGQAEARGNGVHDTEDHGIDDDFLTRERAALGDDAAQFTSPGDNVHGSGTVEDGEEDLLGGGGSYDGDKPGEEDLTEFESSFPVIDTSNSVSSIWSYSRSWEFRKSSWLTH